jgi:hypothetical protein
LAHETLSDFSRSGFPQFTGFLIGDLVRHVDRILTDVIELPACCYESPESSYGACDGGTSCLQKGTIHHLASGLEFCAAHFPRP